MGSFFASCSITNATIADRMPTYVQLLIRNDREYGWDKGLQIYAGTPPFIPFGFPIKGNYNDGGSINNIQKDNNVKKLEDFFNAPIEDIITICGRTGWESEVFVDYRNKISEEDRQKKIKDIKHLDLLKKMNLTYIHSDVYDCMCEGWEKLPTKDSDVHKYDWDGTAFVRSWRNIQLITMLDCDKEELLSGIIDKNRKIYKDLNEMSLRMISERELLNDPTTLDGRETYLGRFIGNLNFIELMQCRIDEFGDDMKKQYLFLKNLRSTGTLIPSMYGTQEVNFRFIKKLNNVLGGILEDGIEEYCELSDEELAQKEIEKRNATIDGMLCKEYDREDVLLILSKLTDYDLDDINLDDILKNG